MQRLVLVLLFVVTACTAELGAARESIVNGSVDTTSASVVGVIHVRPDGTRQLCTGTVVAADVVLTAKHCVFENTGSTTWVAIPATDLFVYTGSDVTAPDTTTNVATITTTAGPYHSGDGAVGGDVALLTTASAVPGVTPLAVARTAPAVSDGVHIVGYGYTASGATGTLGTRHAGDATVSAVAAGTFTSTGAQWTCTGDSGGPAFDASGAVVGVTSIGPAGCRTSTSIYTRLDQNLALIDSVVPPPDADAGTSVDAGAPADGATPPDASSLADAGGPADAGGAGTHRGGCAVGGPGGAPAGAVLVLALLACGARRGRSRRGLS